MRLGMFMMPLHPPHRPAFETYAEDLEKVVAADRLGFDEVWVGEHFSATTESVVNAMMFLAAAIPVTKTIKLGTGVVNLPNHNPIIVAAEAAQFDHLAKGRFLFGIGPGGLVSDFELFNVQDPTEREHRMLEAYDVIRYIWDHNPPYDYEGRFYKVKITENIIPEMGIGYMGKPYQKGGPEVGLSVMSPFSGSAKRAAIKNWSPISANFVPQYIVASHWQKYREGCAEAGIDAQGKRWRVSRNIVIADSEAEAEDLALDPKGSIYFYFEYVWRALVGAKFTIAMKPDPNVPDGDVTVEDIIRSLVLHGTRETVLEKLRTFRAAVGPFETLLLATMDGEGENGVRELKTMRELKEFVLPNLERAGAHV